MGWPKAGMQAEDRIQLPQQFVAQRYQLLVGGKWHILQCTLGYSRRSSAIGSIEPYGRGRAHDSGPRMARGAVVPNAPVTVKNVETGQVYAAASSDSGNYTVPQLPIGEYNLTVAVPGFKTYEHSKFHLSADQTLREDIALQVGQSTESVTVSADASLLQTESSELVHNVTLSQLDNLPLLSVGATNDGLRDYFAASRLLPGIQYSDSGAFSAVVSAVVNGTPTNTLQTRLDAAGCKDFEV